MIISPCAKCEKIKEDKLICSKKCEKIEAYRNSIPEAVTICSTSYEETYYINNHIFPKANDITFSETLSNMSDMKISFMNY